MLEYGEIHVYKDKNSLGKKGFGFVTRKIGALQGQDENIFFHISIIKRKYPHLVQQLDEGRYEKQRFWYITETSEKGEQVSDLWLESKEIPEQLRRELLEYIETVWLDTRTALPKWLDDLTCDLGGQNRRDQYASTRNQIIQERKAAVEEKKQAEEEEKRKKEAERQAKLLAEAEEKKLKEALERQEYLAKQEQWLKRNAEVRPLVLAEEAARKKRQAEYLEEGQRKRNLEPIIPDRFSQPSFYEIEKQNLEVEQGRLLIAKREQEQRHEFETGSQHPATDEQLPEERRQEQLHAPKEDKEIAIQEKQASTAQDRKIRIQQLCQQKNIKTLVHFTRIENLASILQHGLLGRETLSYFDSDYFSVFNDEQRIDGCEDAVCLSISFPNYRMFYRYRLENPEVEWAVLLIKPDVLWELDCAFCITNAASNPVRHIPLNDRRKPEAMESMFSSDIAQREELNIPNNYPTDPQAEVLVLENIPAQYITEVHFDSEACRRAFVEEYHGIIPIKVESTLYSPRSDWSYWKKPSAGHVTYWDES